MCYRLIRPILFQFEPEMAHHLALVSWQLVMPNWLVKLRQKRFVQGAKKLWGLEFPNPIGLAAGLDKNATYIDSLFGMGFGFIEIGAVTPRPQVGNPKPRLFRLPKASALINRMGFNNDGMEAVAARLKARRIPGIVGVNIGKNKDTPIEETIQDYYSVYRHLYSLVDYATINISSPNTPGLRDWQSPDRIAALMKTMKEQQTHLKQIYHRFVPLLVKLSPDLSDDEWKGTVEILLQEGVDGLVLANTTLDHHSVAHLPHGQEQGGLSGKPLFARLCELLKLTYAMTEGKVPLIAAGGIMTADDAERVFQLGADLVQVYTGLIYKGPKLVSDLIFA